MRHTTAAALFLSLLAFSCSAADTASPSTSSDEHPTTTSEAAPTTGDSDTASSPTETNVAPETPSAPPDLSDDVTVGEFGHVALELPPQWLLVPLNPNEFQQEVDRLDSEGNAAAVQLLEGLADVWIGRVGPEVLAIHPDGLAYLGVSVLPLSGETLNDKVSETRTAVEAAGGQLDVTPTKLAGEEALRVDQTFTDPASGAAATSSDHRLVKGASMLVVTVVGDIPDLDTTLNSLQLLGS
ncbi:MAG: hypothetical protein GY788_13530 [bacterium]|nr:hypothetical protein [bacterium]